jgi:hypothetical protein
MTVAHQHLDLSVVAAPSVEVRRVRLTAASKHDTPPAGNSTLIAAELMAARCRWCNDDLVHCHESLVIHAVGEVHCMGADCSTPTELHHMIVRWDDFACTCAQTAQAADATAATG